MRSDDELEAALRNRITAWEEEGIPPGQIPWKLDKRGALETIREYTLGPRTGGFEQALRFLSAEATLEWIPLEYPEHFELEVKRAAREKLGTYAEDVAEDLDLRDW
jgi:hypothetical protein